MPQDGDVDIMEVCPAAPLLFPSASCGCTSTSRLRAPCFLLAYQPRVRDCARIAGWRGGRTTR